MFFFGLMAPNFGSMAMEPLGNNTGPPSSVQGFCTTISRALVGFFVGTFRPLMLGFTLHSLAGMAAVLITEKSRLFQPTASGIATAG
jgi:MFS transporter, DHA1 family, multidrug resistance protein